MTTFDPSNRKRDEAQQVDQAEVRRHDRAQRTDDADGRNRHADRADGADGRAEDRNRHDETTKRDDQADVRGHDRTQQADRPGVRAEEARAPETRTPGGAENQAPVAARSKLFEETEAEQYRMQWRELQANFVDEPRAAVREAETLVSQMMEALTAQLREQKRALEGGSDRDTEQLRVAMQRYRSLFDQMLQV